MRQRPLTDAEDSAPSASDAVDSAPGASNVCQGEQDGKANDEPCSVPCVSASAQLPDLSVREAVNVASAAQSPAEPAEGEQSVDSAELSPVYCEFDSTTSSFIREIEKLEASESNVCFDSTTSSFIGNLEHLTDSYNANALLDQ